MSYRLAFLAVPSADATTARTQLAEMARELRSENGYTGVYLASADHGGLHMMHLTATPAPSGRVPRGFFTERWSGGPLFVAVYNSRSGVYLWERIDPSGPSESILNDGHLVAAQGVTLTVDYAGKGFTHDQLAAVMRKDEAKMTEAEANAVMNWTDAITIGLAQYGFTAKRNDFLALLDATKAWSLLDGTEQPLPPTAGPVIDPYLDEYEFSAHDLEFRDN